MKAGDRERCSAGRRCWESDRPASECGCSCQGQFHGLSLIGRRKGKVQDPQEAGQADPMPTLTRIREAKAKTQRNRPVVEQRG